jgi:exodeoxyribonuclease VII large subunit
MVSSPLTNLSEDEVFTVSQLSTAIQDVLEGSFPFIHVRGEISGFLRARSGHVYFSLKDATSVLEVVCWKNTADKLTFTEGMEIIASGRLTSYGARSRYQLVLMRLSVAGQGDLMALLEARKQKLLAEGLFDAARKRPLPPFPQRVGVVTSPDGAVFHDIMHRLSDRFPVHVLFCPTLVQGEDAPRQIVLALQQLASLPEYRRPDVVILARGGGSFEDLLAFSDEAVVRAVAAMPMSIVSAVGHETDTTLCDFAADVRAPTPTAAAELITPVREDLLRGLEQVQKNISLLIRRFLDGAAQTVDRLGFALLAQQGRFDLIRQTLNHDEERLHRIMGSHLKTQTQRLHDIGHLLEACSHQSILRRGYAAVQSPGDQRWIHSAHDAQTLESADIHFADGIWRVRSADGAERASPSVIP